MEHSTRWWMGAHSLFCAALSNHTSHTQPHAPANPKGESAVCCVVTPSARSTCSSSGLLYYYYFQLAPLSRLTPAFRPPVVFGFVLRPQPQQTHKRSDHRVLEAGGQSDQPDRPRGADVRAGHAWVDQARQHAGRAERDH